MAENPEAATSKEDDLLRTGSVRVESPLNLGVEEIWPGIRQTPRKETVSWFARAKQLAVSGEIDRLLHQAQARSAAVGDRGVEELNTL